MVSFICDGGIFGNVESSIGDRGHHDSRRPSHGHRRSAVLVDEDLLDGCGINRIVVEDSLDVVTNLKQAMRWWDIWVSRDDTSRDRTIPTSIGLDDAVPGTGQTRVYSQYEHMFGDYNVPRT